MTLVLGKADEAVAHIILDAIRADGRKAYLMGLGTQSSDLLTEAYPSARGLDIETFRKAFWAECAPERVVVVPQQGVRE